MTTDTAQAQQAALDAAGRWVPATTDTTLLQAALEEAGRINQVQGKMIEDLREAAMLAADTMYGQRCELANWQMRYQSAADRLAEHWPTAPQVQELRDNLARAEQWLTELKETLTATWAELDEARKDAAGWRDKFYGSYDPNAPIYATGPVAPSIPGPALDTDEEMLG